MNQYKNIKDRQKTDAWLKSNGININQIYVGTAELFQAQSLATTTLKNHGSLLEQNQAAVLNNFLRAARSSKRDKITQAQCFKVLNITKQAQRKLAKLTKRKNTGSH
jgi:predicted ATPase